MAILSTKTLASGVTITYHKVLEANVNFLQNIVEYRVGSYIDHAARLAGNTPVEVKVLYMGFADGVMPTDPRVYFYEQATAPVPVAPVVEAGAPPYLVPINNIQCNYPDAVDCQSA